MTLRERIGLPPSPTAQELAHEPEIERCACRFPERHYGDAPCRVTSAELPLGPEGYCWSCWSARHNEPLDTRPVWMRRQMPAKDFTRA